MPSPTVNDTTASGRLAGKVAIVTGASSGIGKAAAIRFAAEGARVAMVSRGVEAGEAAASEAGEAAKLDGEAAFLHADVSREADVQRLVAAVVERWGRLDCMFNAAGISGRRFGDGPAADCTLEGWQTVIDANLTSVFLCCKYGIQAMLETGGGAIVNLSSVLGLVGGDDDFATHAYAASKGGIIAFTRAVASYYASSRIRANVICPGLIRTNMSLRAQGSPEIVARLPGLQPLTGDFGTPQDVANAALYLVSDESSFVTGEILTVDGGWTTR
jgi:NAD(P)-dependent dehydrogenase (short-subunit alcohol dehydrogenase family)